MSRLRCEVSISDPSQELKAPFPQAPTCISIVNVKLLKLLKYTYACVRELKRMDCWLSQSFKIRFLIPILGTVACAYYTEE